MYYFVYNSPLGEMIATSDGENLLGLYFSNQRYFNQAHIKGYVENDTLLIFKKVKNYLDAYFSGKIVDNVNIPIELEGTDFRKKVWEILKNIPYGKTISYKEIADIIAKQTHKRMSARAVGGAVGHNPISIIIPCHRVLGSNGKMTGYAGGIARKVKLLQIENILK